MRLTVVYRHYTGSTHRPWRNIKVLIHNRFMIEAQRPSTSESQFERGTRSPTLSSKLFLSGGLIGIGVPLLLWWLLDSDYDRYIATINGPFPFSQLGSGPFRLVVYLLTGIATVFLTASGLLVRRSDSKMKPSPTGQRPLGLWFQLAMLLFLVIGMAGCASIVFVWNYSGDPVNYSGDPVEEPGLPLGTTQATR